MQVFSERRKKLLRSAEFLVSATEVDSRVKKPVTFLMERTVSRNETIFLVLFSDPAFMKMK